MDYEKYMRVALEEAEKARQQEEVPIGAIVVSAEGEIIGRGYNLRETQGDPTSHAEMIAIRQAARHVGGWRLNECAIFTTLEPCPMCAGAIIQSRIKEVIYGAIDPKAGCAGTLMNLLTDERFNHRCQVTPRILEEECGGVLTTFFRSLRQRRKE